jgi:SAM-dependent methyltransferase
VTSPDWARWRRDVDVAGYDDRWRRMADAGQNPHGEADFVAAYSPRTVLDAGCGTGRMAIELAARGLDVVGVDLDADMLAVARAKAPELAWLEADLARLDLGRRFDVVVLAGNVLLFVAAADRPAAVAACSRHLEPGGRLINGFQLSTSGPTLAELDRRAAESGLLLEDRYATWERTPFMPGDRYAISVHRSSQRGPASGLERGRDVPPAEHG